ncbi:MAG: hypothetical protein Q7S82_02220 [bacterium]|nr:hypothetical protein [bacterium]
MKKVVIVTEGEWGGMSHLKGDYDPFIQRIQKIIENAETTNIFGKKEKSATIELVETFKDALAKVENGRVDVLVFISRGMLSHARLLSKTNLRKIKIVLFTELVPDDEVIIVEKGPYLTRETIQHIVLQ